jgi:hypothetical protein
MISLIVDIFVGLIACLQDDCGFNIGDLFYHQA